MTVMAVVRPVLLAITIGLIVYMVHALAREGDERQEMILAKAALHTLIVTAALAVICVVRNLAETVRPDWTFDPFTVLVWLALCFTAELFYWKRRYGG